MNANYANAWGILRILIKSLSELQPGKYKLVRDTQKAIIKIYKKLD